MYAIFEWILYITQNLYQFSMKECTVLLKSLKIFPIKLFNYKMRL